MTEAAAKTGVSPTALVAIEQYFPAKQRIIEDDLAYRILPLGLRSLVWLMRFKSFRAWMIRVTGNDTPGLWGGMLCRKRYIDEKLIESANQVNAVVNLGAGFDTRSYRLPALSNMPVWEVDQPENIESKQTRLCKLFGAVPSHVRLVPIDFDREELGPVLASYGYSADKRTFFILEAVTQYLTETGVRNSFDFLAKAERGSRLVFTYIRKDFLDGRVMYDWENIYKKYVKGKIWLFGLDPEEWPDFLKEYGWKVVEHVGYEELAGRYIKPTGRELASTPVERIVYAEKV
ncbi:class I SAM-dependent methyltransferase [Methanosarcina sp. KYL-1]|uniref:class I SAM-dependent methyltransferase n=1 Tax=Methanosarcina sp. KYL-1 TaxID=2602068 RepID=UPI0021016F09|nr:class I SAM-dependent methyltransferase [Methanosarcina sp. KYL-1]MCQ1534751.1 class I SAM-dependent methyltransferase [Methanosarcina sp. KYL-1]